jgi:hypothetical protein
LDLLLLLLSPLEMPLLSRMLLEMPSLSLYQSEQEPRQ